MWAFNLKGADASPLPNFWAPSRKNGSWLVILGSKKIMPPLFCLRIAMGYNLKQRTHVWERFVFLCHVGLRLIFFSLLVYLAAVSVTQKISLDTRYNQILKPEKVAFLLGPCLSGGEVGHKWCGGFSLIKAWLPISQIAWWLRCWNFAFPPKSLMIMSWRRPQASFL